MDEETADKISEYWKEVSDREGVVVTFSMNGHGDEILSQSLLTGDLVARPESPTAEGYTFAGWFESSSLTREFDFTQPVYSDTILYAKWEPEQGPAPKPETFTVTYTDGVEGEEVFADQVYGGLEEGDATPAFDGSPVRDGYVFAGWEPEVAAKVSGDATYAAKWEPEQGEQVKPPTEQDNGGSAADGSNSPETSTDSEVSSDIGEGGSIPSTGDSGFIVAGVLCAAAISFISLSAFLRRFSA